jgi:hypothetical protein
LTFDLGANSVTGHDDADERERWIELGIRVDIPHPARVYDYMLGGQDHFAADREMAEVGLRHMPEMRVSSLENRAFLVRAVRFLRDAGIRQFLDIGTGLPTSPTTHEVAREGGHGRGSSTSTTTRSCSASRRHSWRTTRTSR